MKAPVDETWANYRVLGEAICAETEEEAFQIAKRGMRVLQDSARSIAGDSRRVSISSLAEIDKVSHYRFCI